MYTDENCDNKYEKIIEVLKYLLYDIEIPFEEIEFKNRYTSSLEEPQHKSNDYDGINDVNIIIQTILSDSENYLNELNNKSYGTKD